jgi:hypothetical protein
VPAAGVPEIVAVPSPCSVNVTPAGRVAPLSLSAGAGAPLVVTVKAPDWPTVNLALSALVIAGAAGVAYVIVTTPLPDCIPFCAEPVTAGER